MRILHILDHSLPLHSGYTFRTRAIMKAQLAMGLDVRGVTGARQGAAYAGSGTVDGLTFYRTPPLDPLPSPFGEWREVAALGRTIEDVAQSWRPDVLHAHSPVLNGLAGLRASNRLGLPMLYEIRAFWEDAAVGNGTGKEGSLKYRLTRAAETYVARKAGAVAVICEGLRADLIDRGIAADKIVVSPNGVDFGQFGSPPVRDTALAAELALASAPTIGFVGSFYDYEGLDDLLAAMPLLATRVLGLKLILVGGGPMDRSLRDQAAALGIADRVKFVGRVPHDEVERYYSLIDVLVYPRKRMRLTDLVTPLKPLEAMAQERLVAASDVGGHRELIEDGATGTLFKADDPAAIADAVTGLFADRAGWDDRRRLARRFVEHQRNWSSNISVYQPVYQKLTGLSGSCGKG